MKKLSMFVVLLWSIQTMVAQLQQQNFNISGLPDGWTSININSPREWQFGYNGVMPHSGPTIQSEFLSGAALFVGDTDAKQNNEIVSLTAPPVDLTEADGARIEVTYNLQVSDNKGTFSIEVFDGTSWQQVFFQDSSSPKNTGMNEMVSFDVRDFANEDFQIKFVYDSEGAQGESGLGIAHYRLMESSDFELGAIGDIKFNRLLHQTDNVLVLDDSWEFDKLDVIDSLRGHSREYESYDRSHEGHQVPASAVLFRETGGEMLGSYKVLIP